MVRLSKQTRDRSVSFRKPSSPQTKTGRKKDKLPKGFKEHANALTGNEAQTAYIAQMKK